MSMQADRSNGWEDMASSFLASPVGTGIVESWTRLLPAGCAVLDLGCGPGTPRSSVLFQAGLTVYAVDAAPSMAQTYRRRFPTARVACEPVEDSTFFSRTYEGALAWGLIFLLSPDTQRAAIRRVASVLVPGGRFLFTAPRQTCEWEDRSTGRPSQSLGVAAYESILAASRLVLTASYVDEGENHYYDAVKQ